MKDRMKQGKNRTVRLLCVLMVAVMVVGFAPAFNLKVYANELERVNANGDRFTLSQPPIETLVYTLPGFCYATEEIIVAVGTILTWHPENNAPHRWAIISGQEELYFWQISDNGQYAYHIFNTLGTYEIMHPFFPATESDTNPFFRVVDSIASTNDTTETQPTTSTNAPNLSQASNWAHDGINQAFTQGLIPTELQSNYTQNTTRAEFAALAVALYETATGRTITERANFNDTTDINVQKMGGLGVVTGVGGGNFNPGGTITREQAAVLVARLAAAVGQPLPPSAPTFADNASLSSWAIDGVGQMQASGIMGGVGNNRFNPQGAYTREQSIITMLRLYDALD